MSTLSESPPGRARRRPVASYVAFWEALGATFPSLKGAPSTEYYFECERLVWERYFPPLAERLVLKTDLWNEARGTDILQWAIERGAARVVGIDVAMGTIREARRALDGRALGLVASDVRVLPFADEAFDLVYSMGTIEHFDEYGAAVAELWRVLRPGGVAIIGVPNRLDPFLRPLLVWLLQRMELYAYGAERSFTRSQLRTLLASAGFVVTAETSLLFMPGWLRMLDLWCHTRCRPLTAATGALVRPFAWLYRAVPAVRRHGYLIACVGQKPPGRETSPGMARPEARPVDPAPQGGGPAGRADRRAGGPA